MSEDTAKWFWTKDNSNCAFGDKDSKTSAYAFGDKDSKIITDAFNKLMSEEEGATEVDLVENPGKVDLTKMEYLRNGEPNKIHSKYTSSSLPYCIELGEDMAGIPDKEKDLIEKYDKEERCGYKWVWWNNDFCKDPFTEFSDPRISTVAPHWRPYGSEESKTIESGYQNFIRATSKSAAAKIRINNRFSAGFWNTYKGKQVMVQFRNGDEYSCRPIARAVFVWSWKSGKTHVKRHDGGDDDDDDDDSNGDDKWSPYSLENTYKLEEAMLKKDYEVIIDTDAGRKVVNLVEMVQYDEGDRFKRREVKRVGTAFVNVFKSEKVLARENFPGYWDKKLRADKMKDVLYDVNNKEKGYIVKRLEETSGKGDNIAYENVHIKRIQAVVPYYAFIRKKGRIEDLLKDKKLDEVEHVGMIFDKACNEYNMWFATDNQKLNVNITKGGNLQDKDRIKKYITLYSNPRLAIEREECLTCKKNLYSCGCKSILKLFYCRVILGFCKIEKSVPYNPKNEEEYNRILFEGEKPDSLAFYGDNKTCICLVPSASQVYAEYYVDFTLSKLAGGQQKQVPMEIDHSNNGDGKCDNDGDGDDGQPQHKHHQPMYIPSNVQPQHLFGQPLQPQQQELGNSFGPQIPYPGYSNQLQQMIINQSQQQPPFIGMIPNGQQVQIGNNFNPQIPYVGYPNQPQQMIINQSQQQPPFIGMIPNGQPPQQQQTPNGINLTPQQNVFPGFFIQQPQQQQQPQPMAIDQSQQQNQQLYQLQPIAMLPNGQVQPFFGQQPQFLHQPQMPNGADQMPQQNAYPGFPNQQPQQLQPQQNMFPGLFNYQQPQQQQQQQQQQQPIYGQAF